jgi:AcrR family transcriptional regulator
VSSGYDGAVPSTGEQARRDGRVERGDRTRRTVAAQAASIASVDGLSGMTLSQLAGALGVTKSGVQAAFPTKEGVQLAAIGAASEIFGSSVVVPSLDVPEGLPRLVALVDAWLAYVEGRVLPGGCFMGATFSEYDSRPGPVRDALARMRRGWLRLLESQAAIAQAAGDIPDSPPAAMVAFEVDALLAAANVSRNFTDDTEPLATARELIMLRLGVVASPRRSPRRRSKAPSPDALREAAPGARSRT